MRQGHERPVDKTAALVISRGESFSYRRSLTSNDSEMPLETKEIPEGTPDFRGKKFGRMTVIGYSATKRKRWVCRCVCGTYTLRRLEVVEKGDEKNTCDQCNFHAINMKKEFMRRTGKHKGIEEFK